MIYLLIILLILALCHAAAYWLYTRRVVPKEVARNASDIKANGSADNLRKGYHSRRTWARVWPLLGLAVAASIPAMIGGNIIAFVISFLSLGILLAAYFARFFTPALNVAMGLDYKPEYYASPDSASWPDAAVWKQVRNTAPSGIYDRQPLANAALEKLLARVWLFGRLAYAAGMIATLLGFLHY